jgi:transcriptional regulatory protein GAL4
VYVIAALGAVSSTVESADIDLILFKEAEKHFSIDMLETGSLLLVQAIAFMANYLQKRNKPNSGYNYLGLARRMAMGIGLHKEFNHSDAKLLDFEEKRRTWWCLFVFDSRATITFSRLMDFPAGGVEVNIPLNVHNCVRLNSLEIRSCKEQLLTFIRISRLQHPTSQFQMKQPSTPIYERSGLST